MKNAAEKDLAGRVALITGGSKGIGKTIALTLARRGADIVICGRGASALETAAEEIRACGSTVHAHPLDATKLEGVRDFFRKVIEPIGRLDILVNNIGGVREVAKFPDLTDDDWYGIFDTNLMTMVRVTREALSYLTKSPYARIINIASVAGKQPGDWNPHYGAVKAAMIHLSKSLSRTLGPEHVRVNAICSSTIKGEGAWKRDVESRMRSGNVSFEEAERVLEAEVRAKAPLGEIGTPADVAELVAFLASNQACFITGTCIEVDGGTVRSIF
ncbi:MAG: SDR family oxidoreductase [Candidatus Brennerbacteria bacterium]|nr:SDR family oxidoreductase [Candidatus Brennerbacteria bacterium]